MPKAIDIDFWKNVHIGKRDECWPWLGQQFHPQGYGQFRPAPGQKLVLSHRHAYALEFGLIPKGLIVRHRCDNRPCCNPWHLRTGTRADNVDDMRTGPIGRRAAQYPYLPREAPIIRKFAMGLATPAFIASAKTAEKASGNPPTIRKISKDRYALVLEKRLAKLKRPLD